MPENEEENLSQNVEENIRGIQSMNISDPADQNGQDIFLRTYPPPVSRDDFPNYANESRKIRAMIDEFIRLDNELYVSLLTITPNISN
jgi:hypothetical protein